MGGSPLFLCSFGASIIRTATLSLAGCGRAQRGTKPRSGGTLPDDHMESHYPALRVEGAAA